MKWWPSAQAAVDDLVLLAGPSHGVQLAESADRNPFPMPAAFWQFDSGSNFLAALNAGDETPGSISYTSIYSETDELVQPAQPVPTAGLDWGHEEANTVNLDIQKVCPGRIVDHLSIGTIDGATQELVIDALEHSGPASPARAGLDALCLVPNQYVSPTQPQAFIGQFPRSFGGGFPDMHSTKRPGELRTRQRSKDPR